MNPLSLQSLQVQLREHDYERYICTLFAPRSARAGLQATLLLAHTILSIPTDTSEPMVGLIKLKWWQEQLHALHEGKPPPQHLILHHLREQTIGNDSYLTLCDDLCESIAEQIDLGASPDKVSATMGHVYAMLAAINAYDEDISTYRTLGKQYGVIAAIRASRRNTPDNATDTLYSRAIDYTISPHDKLARKLFAMNRMWIGAIRRNPKGNALPHTIPLLALRLVFA